MDPSAPPPGCSLAPAALADRGREWQRLEAVLLDRRRVVGGLEVRYRDDPGVSGRLQALVEAERRCCGWASWAVTSAGGVCTLRVTGPPDEIGALASAFGA